MIKTTLPSINKYLFCHPSNIFSNLSINPLQSLLGLPCLSGTPRYLIGKRLCWHPKMFQILKKVKFSCPRLTIMFLRFILSPDHASKQHRINFDIIPCLMSMVPHNKMSSAYCRFIILTDFYPLSPSRNPASLAVVIILCNPSTTRTNNRGERESM